MASKPVKCTVDFFKLKVEEGHPSLDKMIQAVHRLRPAKRKTKNCGGTPVCVGSVREADGLIEGDLIRIRMDGLPAPTTLEGIQTELDLANDQGLGENSAFIFDPANNIVALQRNRFGVSRSTFCTYFNEHAAYMSYTLNEILSTEALEQLAKIKEPRKLSLKFARIGDLDKLYGLGLGIGPAVQIMDRAKALDLTLELGMGHSRETLSASYAMDVAKSLLRSFKRDHVEGITKIEVQGFNAEELAEAIDLLNYRIVEVLSKDYNVGRSRIISYVARRGWVREAWDKRKTEAIAMSGG